LEGRLYLRFGNLYNMSRIGKQIIIIPEKTEVTISDDVLIVKGPLGELKRKIRPEIEIVIEGSEIKLNPNYIEMILIHF